MLGSDLFPFDLPGLVDRLLFFSLSLSLSLFLSPTVSYRSLPIVLIHLFRASHHSSGPNS